MNENEICLICTMNAFSDHDDDTVISAMLNGVVCVILFPVASIHDAYHPQTEHRIMSEPIVCVAAVGELWTISNVPECDAPSEERQQGDVLEMGRHGDNYGRTLVLVAH